MIQIHTLWIIIVFFHCQIDINNHTPFYSLDIVTIELTQLIQPKSPKAQTIGIYQGTEPLPLWNYMHSHLLVKRPINKTARLQGSPSVRSPNISSLAGFSPKSWEVGKQLFHQQHVSNYILQATRESVTPNMASLTVLSGRMWMDEWRSYGGCVYLKGCWKSGLYF